MLMDTCSFCLAVDRSLSTTACDTAFLRRLQQARQQQQNAQSGAAGSNHISLLGTSLQDTALFPHLSRTQHFLNTLEQPDPLSQLPAFIKPLPTRFSGEDVKYLHAKGALTLPSLGLQNACLRCFVEFVHPYMPLLDMREFLSIVNDREGAHGQVSLLLYQAVMFASCAFVEMKYLRDAGYVTRKDARRAFFYKTRHLYDLDYESDRLVLVQALLLMSYWYETPDDQKDTWHWMGVAISLAHTIGLHRNPTAASMSMRKQKHWKRIWWSCFMRDRMVALGMRRPTRIKDEDFDVPMLEEDDFEIEPISNDITLVSPECTLLRDVGKQAQLAHMCIAKAKLCILIGRMLRTQYSVLIRDRSKTTDTTNSTMLLFPNKKLENMESVASCDLDLIQWLNDLPLACQYRPLSPLDIKNGNATIAVQRNLLHMVYYTTVSALHRPQFLPSSPHQVPTASRQVQETSRLRVRDSAMQITRMAAELHAQRIDRYLQTTGVTVILPAMIIHLLDMKSPLEQARERAAKGFKSCMRVMLKLREMYSAADYAIGFLDAALQKASIDMQTLNRRDSAARAAAVAQAASISTPGPAADQLNTPPPDNVPYLNSTEMNLFHQNRSYIPSGPKIKAHPGTIIPPSATSNNDTIVNTPAADKDFDSAVCMTPSAISSHSSDHGTNDSSGLGFSAGSMGEDFDWNEAFPSGNIDVDQWLVYPPAEGVSDADAFNVDKMAGVLYNDSAVAAAKAAEEANLALVDNMISWPEDDQDKLQHQQPTPADGNHDMEAQAIAQLASA